MVDDMLFNVAVTFHAGEILAVAPKSYPPEYREFYELRHFARASEAKSKTINLLGQEVPFGNDILIRSLEHPSFVLHTEICEDIWVPIPPSAHAALAGATVLANLSASNITIGKSEYRETLVVGSSGKNLAVQMYSAAGYGESSTDLAWDGDGLIAERGALLVRTERFKRESQSIVTDVDLGNLIQERSRQSSFRENGKDEGREFRTVDLCVESVEFEKPRLKGKNPFSTPNLFLERKIEKHPFVPTDPAKRDIRCYETFMIQATALARRLEQLPPSMRKVILGVSGGQDSTHALDVAVFATDLLGLPRVSVIGITMPGLGTTDRTKNNAIRLMQALGVTILEIPITPVALEIFRSIGHDPTVENLTFENVQAWARKFTELSVACERSGIVLGAGDLSELMLGWTTMFGDHASHYGINAGVPKTLISYLIKWTSDVIYKDQPEVQRVLEDILSTPISPELLSADQGQIAQKTEGIIGPYELHDFFGYYFVRFGMSPAKIARMAHHAFGTQYSIAEIKKWLNLFITRFFRSQNKRSCLPDGPKVGLTCVSPRGDWRMPSDADPQIWLDSLESEVPSELPDLSV
ncbi:MAG: NAD+ synthase (glutamine-hydrolysing) [Parcubacteria group bacterium Gr01-1014_20]|nr:MAG: NAD+ synthase (glutamine-hydrolysing) [Parcubacteria group bacterium Gr01-1014_20]